MKIFDFNQKTDFGPLLDLAISNFQKSASLKTDERAEAIALLEKSANLYDISGNKRQSGKIKEIINKINSTSLKFQIEESINKFNSIKSKLASVNVNLNNEPYINYCALKIAEIIGTDDIDGGLEQIKNACNLHSLSKINKTIKVAEDSLKVISDIDEEEYWED